jgi:hypothetical protein
MEMAFLWGKRTETTGGADSTPLRYMNGLRPFIPSTRVTVFATTPTTTTWLNAVYKVFDYDTGAGDQRIVFAGNGALNALNQILTAAGTVNFGEVVKLYGMNLVRYVLPQGELYIKSHPLMNRHSVYTNSMFIIDPTSLVYRPLRDTKFKDNIQAPDEDRIKGQWLSEVGLEVQYGGLTNAYIGNFTNP